MSGVVQVPRRRQDAPIVAGHMTDDSDDSLLSRSWSVRQPGGRRGVHPMGPAARFCVGASIFALC